MRRLNREQPLPALHGAADGARWAEPFLGGVCREHGGFVRSSLEDTSSGWTVEFVAPEAGKRWRFVTKYQNLVFEMGLGGGTGSAAFTDTLVGGDVEREQHSGYSICEQVALPDQIGIGMMLKIWWIDVAVSKANIVGSCRSQRLSLLQIPLCIYIPRLSP